MNGTGTAASFKTPGGSVLVSGALYVSTVDSIRRVDTSSLAVTTLAGGGTSSACAVDSSTAASVTFGAASGLVSDGTYLYTVRNCSGTTWLVRRTSLSTGATTRLGSFTMSGGSSKSDLVLDGSALFVAVGASIVRWDLSSNTSSVVATEASGWTLGSVAGTASTLWAVARNVSTGLSRLESVDPSTGTITSVSGTGAAFGAGGPGGDAIADAGSYVFVSWGGTIRRYAKADGSFVDVAGTGGFDSGIFDGTGTDAWLGSVTALTWDGAGLWVSDRNLVRRVVDGTALPSELSPLATVSVGMPLAQVVTITGNATSVDVDGVPGVANFSNAVGMAVVGQSVYVAGHGIRRFNLVTRQTDTFVPYGTSGCGTDGLTGGSMRYLSSMTTDDHYLYVADTCGTIKRVSLASGSEGAISTVLSLTSSWTPGSLAMGPDGYLYMAGKSPTSGSGYDLNIYRINPRTGVMSVFATETGAGRLRAMTADADALWLIVEMPCSTSPCTTGQENKLDRIDLATAAITTLVADPRPNATGHLFAPYFTTLTSAGQYLYSTHATTLTEFDKTTGAWADVAGVYAPSQGNVPAVDGYGPTATLVLPQAMASDGHDIFFLDNGGYLRVAVPAPVTVGALDPNSTRGGGNPDSMDCQCQSADPVNTATGEWWETATDVTLPGRYPAPWTRTYSSLAAAEDSPLGFGWAGSLLESLSVPASGSDPVTVHTESGAQSVFDPTGTLAVYATTPRTHATLSKDSTTGSWTYTRRGRLTATFDSGGRLVTRTDRNGETLTLGYNAATPPQLVSVTTADGRALSITYNTAGRIATVTGPSAAGTPARTTSYGYDPAGNLTTVTDSRGGTWTYTYDANHRMTSASDPTGATTTTHYDSAGRVDWQQDARSKTTTFDYTDTTSGTDQLRTTRVSDPTGVTTDDAYTNGWLTSRTLAPGTADAATWTYGYDQAGNQTSSTDPTGRTTTATFDGRGNRLTQTVSSGATMTDGSVPGTTTTTWTYNSFNEPLTQITTAGASTTWTYDTRGNVLTQVRKLTATTNATTTWTHTNPAHPGDTSTVTDPRGNTTSYTYTAEGFTASVTTPAGHVTGTSDTTVTATATYDPYGDVLTRVDPRGHVTGATPAGYTTTNTYDDAGLLNTTTSPLGLVTTYGYDADGRRTTVTNNTAATWTTRYLPTGQVDTLTDPLGHTTTYGYDDAGRCTSVTDPTGAVTTTSYNNHGQPATTTRPAGNVTGATPTQTAAATTTYGYDAADRPTTSSNPDPNGGADLVTTTTYDAAGRAWKTTDPAGLTTTSGYDSTNRLTSLTDPAGDLTRYTYDYADRTTSSVDPRSKTTSYTYDAGGNLTKTVDPLTTTTSPTGRATTQTWDSAGRLWTVTDPRGNATGAPTGSYTTTYGYDAAGNPTTVTDALGHTTTTAYDTDGRTTTLTNPLSHATSYTYDTTGRLATITAPDGGTTTYGYDTADRQTSITAPEGGIWSTGYDNAGRVISQTDPATTTRTYTYTPDGALATITSARGTTTRTYDTLDRLTAQTYTDTTPTIGYTYDRDSRRATLTDAEGTLTYAYDNASRTTSITRTPTTGPATNWAYTYDTAGNVLTRTRPDTSVETWTYDNAGQPTKVVAPTGTTTFTYDDAGNTTATALPNTTTETRTWDATNALTSITTTAGSTVLTSQTVTRDNNRQPTTTVVTRNGTSETRTYLYDPNERLTDVCYTTTCTPSTADQHWTYDLDGNPLTQRDGAAPGTTTTRTYDTSDRITSTQTGTAAATTPTYDADGNLTNDSTGHAYTYRLDGLTATSTTPATTTSYTYDGDGNRTHALVTAGPTTGTTTSYTWDTNSPLTILATISTDPDGAGPAPASTTTLRYDQGGTGTPISQTTDGTNAWYSHDPLAGITDLTTPAAVIGSSQDWTPYGQTRAPIGSPTTPTGPAPALGWTGALPDTDGSYYLRARQYLPNTTQLTARDPLGLVPSAGPTGGFGSLYGYTNARVTLQTDPSGMWLCDNGADSVGCSVLAGIGAFMYNAGNAVAHPVDTYNGWVDACNAGFDQWNGAGLEGTLQCIDNLNPAAQLRDQFAQAYDLYQRGCTNEAVQIGSQAVVGSVAYLAPIAKIGTAGVAADTAVDSGGGLVSRLRGLDWADDTGSVRIPGSGGRLTNSQAAQMAERVGYRPTNYISRGEKVFTNGKTFITQDTTSHTGGLWKMANSVQELRAGARLGTYDYDLNWIAP